MNIENIIYLSIGFIFGILGDIIRQIINNVKEKNREKREAVLELHRLSELHTNIVVQKIDMTLNQAYYWSIYKNKLEEENLSHQYELAQKNLDNQIEYIKEIIHIQPEIIKQIIYIGSLYKCNVQDIISTFKEQPDIMNIYNYFSIMEKTKDMERLNKQKDEAKDILSDVTYRFMKHNDKIIKMLENRKACL